MVKILKLYKIRIRSKCYDRVQKHSAGTPILYKKVMSTIEAGASILEIGIGNGLCIEKNADIIKEKNIRIKGIDIDEEYIFICNERIMKTNLKENVTCHLLNLLEMGENEKFDYILFPGSYPVISPELMDLMMIKSFKLLRNSNSKILFVHSLHTVNDQFPEFMFKILDVIKRNIKYVPFVWTDFGRLTTIDNFQYFINRHNLSVIKIQKLGVANENNFKKIFYNLIGITFQYDNYMYQLSFNEENKNEVNHEC